MGVFHFFKIVQIVPNDAKHLLSFYILVVYRNIDIWNIDIFF